jgi:hypothetical protein
MPRRKPAPQSSGQLRRSIAAAAARLMADDGIEDFATAKRKAARQLGAAETESLPSNDEIEESLRDYQALFQGEEHREHLMALRQIALEVMAELADFRPCLTGPVLDGTAGRYAAIQLDLFADSSKDVEIFLLSRDVDYAADELQRRGPHSPETRLRLEWSGCEVELNVFPLSAERETLRNPHSGRARSRARPPAVAALLANEA